MSFDKECCIKPWDTNETLKATFKFLKRNQRDELGNILNTLIYLGTASLKHIDLNTYEERDLVSNILIGRILEVLDYSVVMGYEGENGPTIMTVAYEKISNIQSNMLVTKREKYLEYMNNLEPLCKAEGNSYYDILIALEGDLDKYKCIVGGKDKFVFFYSGYNSQSYDAKQITIVRNLLLIVGGIIPVNMIDGYMIVKEPLVKEGDEDNE